MEAVLRMALAGRHERISARRAYQLGIVSDVIDPPVRLRAAATELAELIARQPAAELAATKQAMWEAMERTP
jgi:enoyl-CoA hydratase/carnithine racemase